MSPPTHPPLPVIATMFNPWGYAAITRNAARFAQQMEANPAIELYLVECAFKDRPFVLTDAHNPRHLQVRTNSVLWIKERNWVLGRQLLRRVTPGATKAVFLDADVEFLDADWAARTVESLDHHDVIQPWSEAIYAGPKSELAGIVTSFMSQYVGGKKWTGHPPKYGESMWHPGFAWAWRLDALDAIGGLLDINVVGGADLEMALGLVGMIDEALAHQNIIAGRLPAYEAAVTAWQGRADRIVRRNVGFLPGMIRHYFHGNQVGRQYESRYAIPLKHNYHPHQDLIVNSDGVYEWAPHVTGLAYDVRGMFAARNDDANTPG